MPLSSVVGAQSIVRPGVCTSSTRPASPYDGQVIYETDTDKTLVWNGSGWVFLSTSRANPGGLDFIKAQTIGSAVSSVEVTGAFSSTYDNYLIMINGGTASSNVGLGLQLGSTTTGYYAGAVYVAYNSSTVTGANTNNGSNWTVGTAGTNTINGCVTLLNPFASDETTMLCLLAETFTTGLGLYRSGYLANSTSYTSFTLIPNSGTLTGGTIRVYGYVNS